MVFAHIFSHVFEKNKVYFVGIFSTASIFFISTFTSALKVPFERVYVLLLPLQERMDQAFSFPSLWLRYQQSGISRVADLEARNAELRTRIAESEFLRQENQELKKVLGDLGDLDNTGIQRVAVARIISNNDQQHTVDQGMTKGVQSGDLVLSNGAFIGLVSQVENEFSRIQLVTEGTIRVLATTLKGVNGVLLARDHQVLFTEIPLDADIQVGEYIYSLGSQSNQIPSGVVIGQVKDVKQDMSMSTKIVTVDLLGDADSFQLVLIGRK